MLSKPRKEKDLINAYQAQQSGANASYPYYKTYNFGNYNQATTGLTADSTKKEVENATKTTNTSLVDQYNYNAPTQSGINKTAEYKNLVNQKTSALSTANAANRTAMKYADNAALAQGYATQGAALQNVGTIQNAYQNQVGGINQQYQQQLGELKDTKSEQALANYINDLSILAENGNFSQEDVDALQQAYYDQLSESDLQTAKGRTGVVLSTENRIQSEMNAQEQETQTQQAQENNNEYSISTPKGEQATVSFVNGSNHNKNFVVTIGNDKFEVELGKKVENILGSGSLNAKYKLKMQQDAKNRAIGEIWEYTNPSGKTWLLIKDGNGDVRMVEAAIKPSASGNFTSLVERLGFEGVYTERYRGIPYAGQMHKK